MDWELLDGTEQSPGELPVPQTILQPVPQYGAT